MYMEQSIHTIAFLLDSQVIPYVVLGNDQSAKEVPPEIEALGQAQFDQLVASGQCLPNLDYHDAQLAFEMTESISIRAEHFSGSFFPILPDLAHYQVRDVEAEPLLYIPPLRQPNLFRAAYSTPEELLGEFQVRLRENDIWLPDTFNWWRNIVLVDGICSSMSKPCYVHQQLQHMEDK